MVRKAALGALALLLLPAPAHSADTALDSGNLFLSHCEAAVAKGGDVMDFGLCHGFVQGVLARDEVLEVPLRQICAPPTSTWGQQLAIVTKYIRDNPQTRHIHPLVLVALALRAAFPCSTQK